MTIHLVMTERLVSAPRPRRRSRLLLTALITLALGFPATVIILVILSLFAQ
jgi:hypothetical protein